MSVFEYIVVFGIAAILFALNALQNAVSACRLDENSRFADEVLNKLSAIEDRLAEVEGHTARVAEPLYDQDKIDREHLVGKYADPY